MFYDNFILACSKKGVTPTSVITKIGLSRGNVTFWKDGAIPSSENIIKLSDILNVSCDFLLRGKEYTGIPFVSSESKFIDMFESLNDLQKAEVCGYMKGLIHNNV